MEKRRKEPIAMPETLKVRPLEAVPPPTPLKGRPKKLKMPRLPDFKMGDLEREWFDYFIAAFQDEYPDLIDTDRILLHLAAVEYIKYLRVAAEELESGQVISMARQHPGTQMRGLLDQLSVTRKQRQGAKSAEAEEKAATRSALLGLSR